MGGVILCSPDGGKTWFNYDKRTSAEFKVLELEYLKAESDKAAHYEAKLNQMLFEAAKDKLGASK